MSVTTFPVIVKGDSCVLERIMALVSVENASASLAGLVSPVTVGQQMRPVFPQEEEKFALERANVSVELVNALKEKREDTLVVSVRNVR